MDERMRRIGISFQPDFELEHLPVAEAIPAGTYMAYNSLLVVDVIGQDAETGRVTIEFTKQDSDEREVDTIGAELFNQLFYRLPPMTVGKQA